MKTILLFGAGKSATCLIQYLVQEAEREGWFVVVADANLALAKSKTGSSARARAVSFDIAKEMERERFIKEADIVISLLPPSLHILVANDCIRFEKNLLTASYVDDSMKSLKKDIEAKGLLFLCEMGLDPGIDHMSAKKMIDGIHGNGGIITSFLSHCGGLVAPQSDTNPWHYKISWNPRNVVLAGKGGAFYKQNREKVQLPYPSLFNELRLVKLPNGQSLAWYPNRDSLSYTDVYGLQDCPTFIRTTLRHPDFISGWKNLIELKMTDESAQYDTAGKSLWSFFKEHLEINGLTDWLKKKMQQQYTSSKQILEDLVKQVDQDKETKQTIDEFMMVNEKGDLEEVDIDEVKVQAATTVAYRLQEAKLALKQLYFLGINDDQTFINKGICSPADVLQFILETKMPLLPADKDLVVMMHEIEYEWEGALYKIRHCLQLEGENAQHTAMAKTVGLPLGIAAKLILKGEIKLSGLQIPVLPLIYHPVLNELEKHGIIFQEEIKKMS